MKRLVARVLRKLRKPRTTSGFEAYSEVCLTASQEERAFSNFRRNAIYNAILEHVSKEQGAEYLKVIATDTEILSALDQFRKNDDFGGPRTFEYPPHGRISPTTLRYIKVLSDLKLLFETLTNLKICEIGVGYGGQCRIINAWFTPTAYHLVDLAPVLALARRYLRNYRISARLHFETINELDTQSYDLVISNYAFTELPRGIQDVYLEKVLLRSARGYITYNEPPEGSGSYMLDELLRVIPGAKKLSETPLTHPKNCIIVWGDSPSRERGHPARF